MYRAFHKHRTAWFLLAVCFLFAILRLPSLVEPHWYGDEGIYQVVGRALVSGRVLYKDIWDNKPPLLYIIYAIVNGNLFLAKLLSLLSGLASVVVFYKLSEKIFQKSRAWYLSTITYSVLFGLPILEGNIANAENFMLLPVVLAAYLVIKYSERKKNIYLIIAGLLLSIALVTKIVAVFDFFAFVIFIFIISGVGRKQDFLKPFLSFFIPLISLLLLFSLYFLSMGSFKDFASSVFLQNVSYVGDQNRFVFPMGILIIKSVILLVSLFVIFANKSKLSKATLFIYIWTLFSIFNAFFSERPYIHYLLVLLPSFSLLLGNFIEDTKTRVLGGAIILFVVTVAYFHFQVYKKTISYYENYISFITNNKRIVDYEAFFDGNTPRDYDIANFINMNVGQNDKVFLWSDSAQIYALSNKLPIGKYIVAYHITFYKNADIITKEQIEITQPKYIIQTIEEPFVENILSSYQLRYIMEGAKIYEREI